MKTGSPAKPLLHVEGLQLRRGGRAVLRGVSFDLRPGEILCVIGPNGAGKTTLLECVAGLRRIDAGMVSFQGQSITSLRAAAQTFSFLLDEAELPEEATVATLLMHAERCSETPRDLGEELRDKLNLSPLLAARGRELSRGERRRVALFIALCSRRPVAVLDEPLGVFDPLQLRDILALIRARAAAGTAFLMSVHQMSDAEKIADRCLLLADGCEVACGTLQELRDKAEVPAATLEQIFLALLERSKRVAA